MYTTPTQPFTHFVLQSLYNKHGSIIHIYIITARTLEQYTDSQICRHRPKVSSLSL